jgi:hypothetical protein
MWFDTRQGLPRWFFAKRSIEELCLFSGEPKREVRKKFFDFELTNDAWADSKNPQKTRNGKSAYQTENSLENINSLQLSFTNIF